MLREIWDTKAEWMIIIDYGNKAGFQSVGDAREYLLRKGRKQVQRVANAVGESAEGESAAESSTAGSTPPLTGTHVVAPVSRTDHGTVIFYGFLRTFFFI